MKPSKDAEFYTEMAEKMKAKMQEHIDTYNRLSPLLDSEDRELMASIQESAKTGTVNQELVNKLLDKHTK